MASWLPLPSSIQKRFLSYVLSKIGVFDDASLDLDNLNLTLGRQNIVELKDVALDASAISKKANLPPSFQITAGKVSLLRLMVPADIHKSGIVIDAVGVRVSLRYQEEDDTASDDGGARTHGQSPAHRKTTRRIASPLRKRGRGHRHYDEDTLPTAQDLARSFLLDEPLEERQQLEASVAAHTANLDESVISESSQGAEPGTGAPLGVPAFLTAFLTGVLDRVIVNIKDVRIVLDAHLSGSSSPSATLAFQLCIANAQVWSSTGLVSSEKTASVPTRHLQLSDITLDLLSDPVQSPEISQSVTSPSNRSSSVGRSVRGTDDLDGLSRSLMTGSRSSLPYSTTASSHALFEQPLQSSIHTVDADRFADAHDDEPTTALADSQFDIRPGDDNISWGSRQHHQGPGTRDLWDSVADEDDLPDSLLFDEHRAAQRRAQISHQRLLDHSPPRVYPHDDVEVARPRPLPSSALSQQRSSMHESPGSWPSVHESRSNISETSTEGSAQSMASALEHEPATQIETAPVPQESPSAADDETLAQSRIFSHAEAESMYMSAISPETESSTAQIAMPGAWGAESSEGSIHAAALTEDETKSALNTPRAQSPVSERRPERVHEELDSRNATTLISVEDVKLSMKSEDRAPGQVYDQGPGQPSVQPARPRVVQPERTMLRQESSLSAISDSFHSSEASFTNELDDSSLTIAVEVASIHCQLDISTLQMLIQTGIKLPKAQVNSPKRTSAGHYQASNSPFVLDLSIQQTTLDVVRDSMTYPSPMNLASLKFSSFLLRKRPDEAKVQLSKFGVFLGDTQILSFNPEHTTADKVRQKPDLDLTYSITHADVKNRTVPEISVQGQVIVLNIDLPSISRSLEHVGALSSILEVGSMLKDHTTTSSPTSSRRPTTSVRFTDDTVANESATPKTNMRLAGVIIDLKGRSAGLSLRTSSLKAVQRGQGMSLSTAKVEVSELLSSVSQAQNVVFVDGIRVDFLNTPGDKDLEKFLALLTPSNDKYENDGDILIETLIRQRRKGACLRLHVDVLRSKIQDYQSLAQLATLGSDLNQLSAVTKYLPEDDRPGLLTMVRVKEIDAQLPTNPSLGDVKVCFQELQCAHVGLPALFAVALCNLSVSTKTELKLLHQLLPYQGNDNLPMVMARMLGDEVEPTVKVKLFNICVEYSVPTLLGIVQTGDTETLATDLVNSIADLTFSTYTSQRSPIDAPQPAASEKKTKIDLSIHSSGIGLTPLRLKSKALFVLSDSKLSLSVPPAETTEVSLELRRAAMFITNDAGALGDAPVVTRRVAVNTTTDTRVADALAKLGYASVASIMSARVDVRISETSTGLDKLTEVDIRNELMLMESCADSTQTLFATLGALSPPSPPSKQPKYLTEPVSLEDMISSFSGEAVPAREQSRSTLFDAEDDLVSNVDMDMQASQIDDLDAEDLLFDPEMTSSVYGPVSGFLDDPDDQDDDSRPPVEAAESLLEEDPFVMTVTPDDLPFSDATLLKDLRQQNVPDTIGQAVDLPMMEIDDVAYNALGPTPDILGDPRRFCPPSGSQPVHKQDNLRPIVKVRLRDVHFIWNLHDGFDWQKTRDGITSAVEQVEQRAEERVARRRQSRNQSEEEESVIGDFLFNSIYIGIPSTQEAQDIRRQINRHIDDLTSETESVPLSGMSRPTAYSASGRPLQRARRRLKLERGRSHKIAFELKGLSLDFSLFPPDASELQSSVDVRVQSFEIFDNVPTSTWRKFLTLLNTGQGREMAKPMIHLQLQNVKTVQNYAATEMVIRVTLLPLRLHVDQDALDFITRFFEFKDDSVITNSEPAEQPFLQRVEVDTVDLQLDYKPKKIDYVGLRSGHTTEFMNFVILDAANIRLKHAIIYGIKGFEPLHKTLNDVWMPDVRRNQLPTVLAGLAPVRSLVNIGTGVRDVVAIPVREYQKDGRIVRSIQKGAFHFGKTTASELARLGAKVAIGTQNILSGAEELLSPSSASPLGRPSPSHRISSDYGWHEVEEDDGDREKRAISAYADQPLGVLAGLRSARRYLEHDLLSAKDALIAVQGEVLSSNTPGGAAAAVARHAPTVILRPVIGASRAVGTALLGVGNQIDRDNLRRMEDKYKRR